ncbi:MAG: hypothetical protein JO340_13020 [Acidobacteriaceae bacterium]|nr:hypothetical protein [Acidobacteriaceae bacterium]
MPKRITETVPYDAAKAVRKLARERVGAPKQEKIIEPKNRRRPKHKKAEEESA